MNGLELSTIMRQPVCHTTAQHITAAYSPHSTSVPAQPGIVDAQRTCRGVFGVRLEQEVNVRTSVSCLRGERETGGTVTLTRTPLGVHSR